MTLPPYTLGCYLVCGSNFVRRLNGIVAWEERKNGVMLLPRIHALWNVGKSLFSNEMEVIFMIDLLAEKEGDPKICFS